VKKILNKLFTILFLLLLCISSTAQIEFDPRKDFIHDGDYFKPYSPYLTVNYGYGHNFKPGEWEHNWAVDYHHRFKYEYLHFNFGYFSSSDKYFRKTIKKDKTSSYTIYRSFQRCHNLHAGAGTRYTILKHNFGVYAGIAAVSGIEQITEKTGITRFGPGAYLQAHYHYKPVYDLGIGINIYAAYSKHFKILGLQASILFSADFKPPVQPVIYN